MARKSGYGRRLTEDEPADPTEAWIETADGGRVDCALEQTGPRAWRARPPVPYRLQPGDTFRIDRLPGGGAVEFADVLPPEEPSTA